MNKKMVAIVMLVVIGTLVVSAFSWAPNHTANHEGLAIYHQSERAGYAAASAMIIYHLSEWNSTQVMAFHYGPPGR